MLMIMLFEFTTCFSLQIKLNQINQLPVAKLKSEQESTAWYVLDGSSDKLILLKQDSKNIIKIVKLEEIDRISAHNK